MASLRRKPALPGVRYLFFDVFGTVVDWRRGTARQLFEQCQLTIAKGAEESGVTRAYAWYKAKSMGLSEWQDFTNEWLEGHSDMVWSIATANIEGREPPAYKTIDEYQVESFPLLIQKWELHGLWDEATTLRMSMALHRLPPWLDSPEGIKALNAAGF